eukprot:7947644-Ditylum_brightwellii.AAC.1
MAKSTNVQEQTVEALLQLCAATKEERSTMSNLTNTNTQLTECVANLSTMLNAKDEEIRALQCSIDNLTNTMRSFTMLSMVQYQPVFDPNMMQPSMQLQPAFHQNETQPPQSFNPSTFLMQQQQSTPNSGAYNTTGRGGGCNQNHGQNRGQGKGRVSNCQQQL